MSSIQGQLPGVPGKGRKMNGEKQMENAQQSMQKAWKCAKHFTLKIMNERNQEYAKKNILKLPLFGEVSQLTLPLTKRNSHLLRSFLSTTQIFQQGPRVRSWAVLPLS